MRPQQDPEPVQAGQRWVDLINTAGRAAALFGVLVAIGAGEVWLANCLGDHLAAVMIVLILSVITLSMFLPLFTKRR